MDDPAFPKFPPDELEAANRRIAECLALSMRALEEAGSIANHYKIPLSIETPILDMCRDRTTLYYEPERHWISSDHECKVQNYEGSNIEGWSFEKPQKLTPLSSEDMDDIYYRR